MYTTEIAEVFSDQAIIDSWLAIGSTVANHQIKRGLLKQTPPGYSSVDPRQWRARVEAGQHEVVAFLTEWGYPGAHLGMTSSDLTDTGLSMRLNAATDLLWAEALNTVSTAAAAANRGKMIDRVPRTHGQWAGPLIKWYDAWWAAVNPLRAAASDTPGLLPAHLSGPVGIFSQWLPRDLAAAVANDLDLPLAYSTAQCLPRSVYVRWAQHVGALADGCVPLARLIRAGASSDRQELTLTDPVASSSMPHKANPSEAERVEGLAILVRSLVSALATAQHGWDERDLVHSSVERIAIPQIVTLTHYILRLTKDLILSVEYNLGATGQVRSAASYSGALSSFNARCAAQAEGTPYLEAHAAYNTKGSR